MARTSLPPGFRFHPTDVELVLYYLKRKVMGKKFNLEAIAEVNIYRFSPWDLPDKSCLHSKDLEWYFFCPREKKYASGLRVKRATENGYWKITGKDRPVRHNDKTVGTVKTLVFHLGHAPQGERTDWVLHEYRILDNHLASAGVQDAFVLCKIFKKNGPGPKNGAQYGAPFNEVDWDDVDDDQSRAISLTSDGPSTTVLQTDDQSHAISLPSDGPSTAILQTEEPPVTGLSGPGPLTEDQSTSFGHPTSEMFVDETDDEIVRLLAQFADDDMMLCHESQADLSGKGKNILLPCSDEYDIYNGLGDLNSSAPICSLENQLLLDSSSYIELDDLLTPLDCPAGCSENVQSAVGEIFGPYNRRENVQRVDSGASSIGMGQYAARVTQLPMPPVRPYGADSWLGVPQTVNYSLYQGGCNDAYHLDFALGQLDNCVNFAQDDERGSSDN